MEHLEITQMQTLQMEEQIMASFLNLSLGVIETPSNKSVVEQYRKRPELYKELQDSIAHSNTTPKNMLNLTLKELKQQADMLGLSYNKNASKTQILALLEKAL